jgi:hypothetical protein
MFSAGLTSSYFGGDQAAMMVTDGATVTLVECSFINNTINSTFLNSAVLSVNAVDPSQVLAQSQDTIVRLQQCSFTNNVADALIVTTKGGDFSDFSALVYSDAVFDVVTLYINSVTQNVTEPLSAAPPGRPGITGTSPWLRSAQQVRFSDASCLSTCHFI